MLVNLTKSFLSFFRQSFPQRLFFSVSNVFWTHCPLIKILLCLIVGTKVLSMISIHFNMSLIFLYSLPTFVRQSKQQFTYAYMKSSCFLYRNSWVEPTLSQGWGNGELVGWVGAWICGKIQKEKLYIIFFVHVSHPAFLARLNKMKSISRTKVWMGERICTRK